MRACRRAAGSVRTPAWQGIVAFAVCFGLMVVPWAIRNSISVGKFAMTEEYGSAAIVERFAFNQMTPKEYALAFPHCLPVIGPCIVAATVGEQATARFKWDSPGSFFELGRGARGALLKVHEKLDPIIGDVMRAELRHKLVAAYPGQHSAGLVRALGRRRVRPVPGAGLCLGRHIRRSGSASRCS